MTSNGLSLFPERLLLALHRQGLNQSALARKIGSDPRIISNYISGKTLPSAQMIYKLAEALEVSLDWLLGRSDDPGDIGIQVQHRPQIKILYRALKDGSKPSTRTLMMLAESIIKEREKAGIQRKEGGKD